MQRLQFRPSLETMSCTPLADGFAHGCRGMRRGRRAASGRLCLRGSARHPRGVILQTAPLGGRPETTYKEGVPWGAGLRPCRAPPARKAFALIEKSPQDRSPASPSPSPAASFLHPRLRSNCHPGTRRTRRKPRNGPSVSMTSRRSRGPPKRQGCPRRAGAPAVHRPNNLELARVPFGAGWHLGAPRRHGLGRARPRRREENHSAS